MTTAAATTMEIGSDAIVQLREQLARLQRKRDDALAGQKKKPWYTTREVAARKGVAEDTIREACHLGCLDRDQRPHGRTDAGRPAIDAAVTGSRGVRRKSYSAIAP